MRPRRKYAQVIAEQQDRARRDQPYVQLECQTHEVSSHHAASRATCVGCEASRSSVTGAEGSDVTYPQTLPATRASTWRYRASGPSRPANTTTETSVGTVVLPRRRSHQLAKNRMSHSQRIDSEATCYGNVTSSTIAVVRCGRVPPYGGIRGSRWYLRNRYECLTLLLMWRKRLQPAGNHVPTAASRIPLPDLHPACYELLRGSFRKNSLPAGRRVE